MLESNSKAAQLKLHCRESDSSICYIGSTAIPAIYKMTQRPPSYIALSIALCMSLLLTLSGQAAATELGNRPASLSIDHLFYLEGLRLGLDQSAEVLAASGNSLRAMAHHGIDQPPLGKVDRSNPIFRQHVAAAARRYWVNKAPRLEPSAKQLETFYLENKRDYFVPALISFEHHYFRTPKAWPALLERLNSNSEIKSAAHPLGSQFSGISQQQLERRFGEKFATAAFAITAQDIWQGPLESNLGFHLVKTTQRQPAAVAPLERIKATLVARWQRMQQEQWLEGKTEEIRRRLQHK